MSNNMYIPVMDDREEFVSRLNSLAKQAHVTAAQKGFWDVTPRDGELLALIHSEVSEALEACRKGNPPDKHLTHRDSFSVELADCIIRVLDVAASKGIDIGSVVVEKMEFNKTRPHKHGKLF